jgi:hypothetical protein
LPVSTDSNWQDRRLEVRHCLGLSISCKTVDQGAGVAWQGECQDLSRQGIRLLLDRRFQPGTLLLIELQAPNRSMVHSFLTRVRWTEKHDPAGWVAGCVLVCPLSDEEEDSLVREASSTSATQAVCLAVPVQEQCSPPTEPLSFAEKIKQIRERLRRPMPDSRGQIG